MLKDKYILGTKMEPYLDAIGSDRERVSKIVDNLKSKYNLPKDISQSIIYGRRFLGDFNPLICYWITTEIKPSLVDEFFTKVEIKSFKGLQYEDDEPVLPLRIPALQLATDQWLATMSIKDMMKLRKNSLIHYNAETQRALKMMVKGEEVVFVPFVNQSAVRAMMGLFENNNFIPNVITFNINTDDEEADVSFKDGILKINSLTAFDIVDGYNRFKMFEKEYDKNPDVDFTSGLMITRFSTPKAKQFIHQEDQKTKMKRVDSDSYNQNDEYNILLERVNNDPRCAIYGQINSNAGHVPFGIAARSLKIGNVRQRLTQKDLIQYNKQIIERINILLEDNTELLERKWSDCETCIVFYHILNKDADEINTLLASLTHNKQAVLEITKVIRSSISKNKIDTVIAKYIGGEQ